MSDWALASCERQEFSNGLADRGAANAKGVYAELRAATGFAYSAISLLLHAEGGGGQCYLVDIAIGASGSEQVIVPNVLLDSARGIFQSGINITLPVAIPAGVRLSARAQETGGAGTRQVNVTIIGRSGGSNYAPPLCGSVVNYGAIPASTNGTLVDPGAVANAYGAWTELTSATLSGHRGVIVILGTNQSISVLANSPYNFQLAVGSAASEIPICEFVTCTGSSGNRFGNSSFDVLASIPVGTRLSMRAKCRDDGTAAARSVTAILLGL